MPLLLGTPLLALQFELSEWSKYLYKARLVSLTRSSSLSLLLFSWFVVVVRLAKWGVTPTILGTADRVNLAGGNRSILTWLSWSDFMIGLARLLLLSKLSSFFVYLKFVIDVVTFSLKLICFCCLGVICGVTSICVLVPELRVNGLLRLVTFRRGVMRIEVAVGVPW